MREIKFRGKIRKGYIGVDEWMYFCLDDFVDSKMFGDSLDVLDLSCIDFNTICQFTGLLDCNGKEIYEGDRVEIDDREYTMVFEDGCFLLDGYDNGDYYQGSDPLCTDYSRSTVIGTVHDKEVNNDTI